ncbi:MAG: hypothetical protein M1831_001711 [Alyxoria varia]|nr:MAG: hypothetical protein M1831_001711 [Alyxoria varia]
MHSSTFALPSMLTLSSALSAATPTIHIGNLTLSNFEHCIPARTTAIHTAFRDAIAISKTASARHKHDIGWHNMRTDPGFLEYFGPIEASGPRLPEILENVEQLADMAETGGDVSVACEIPNALLGDSGEHPPGLGRECGEVRRRFGVRPMAFVRSVRDWGVYPQAPNVTFCDWFFENVTSVAGMDRKFAELDKPRWVDATWLRRSQAGIVLHELTHVESGPLQFFHPRTTDFVFEAKSMKTMAYGPGRAKLLALFKNGGPQRAAQNADNYEMFIVTSWARKHFRIPYPSFPRAWNPNGTTPENQNYEKNKCFRSLHRLPSSLHQTHASTPNSSTDASEFYSRSDFANSPEMLEIIDRDGLFQPIRYPFPIVRDVNGTIRAVLYTNGKIMPERVVQSCYGYGELGVEELALENLEAVIDKEAEGPVQHLDFEDGDAKYSVQYV